MLPAPFLKWAGGKRQLLSYIEARIPERIDTYFEPFMGGAAVFFRLAARRSFQRAVLADANRDLVVCYKAVARGRRRRHRRAAASTATTTTSTTACARRSPRRCPTVERAARVIYLNRCGYNGLYRVNSKGRFNVPFGRYKQPVICDEEKLRAASRGAAQGERWCAATSPASCARSVPTTSSTSTRPTFRCRRRRRSPPTPSASSAHRIRNGSPTLLRDLAQRKVPALLSNSYCRETRDLYLGFDHEKVPARRVDQLRRARPRSDRRDAGAQLRLPGCPAGARD